MALELTEKYAIRFTIDGKAPQVGIEQYSALIEQFALWKEEQVQEENPE